MVSGVVYIGWVGGYTYNKWGMYIEYTKYTHCAGAVYIVWARLCTLSRAGVHGVLGFCTLFGQGYTYNRCAIVHTLFWGYLCFRGYTYSWWGYVH